MIWRQITNTPSASATTSSCVSCPGLFPASVRPFLNSANTAFFSFLSSHSHHPRPLTLDACFRSLSPHALSRRTHRSHCPLCAAPPMPCISLLHCCAFHDSPIFFVFSSLTPSCRCVARSPASSSSSSSASIVSSVSSSHLLCPPPVVASSSSLRLRLD